MKKKHVFCITSWNNSSYLASSSKYEDYLTLFCHLWTSDLLHVFNVPEDFLLFSSYLSSVDTSFHNEMLMTTPKLLWKQEM